MKKTLVFIENKSWKDSLDLLEAADQIFANKEHVHYGAAYNLEDANAWKEIQANFDFFIPIHDNRIVNYDAVNIAGSLAALCKEHDFDCILIQGSAFGRILAPRLAMRLGAPLCADVTMVEQHNGEPLLVRPAFDGKMLAAISCTGKKPIMASIRAGNFSLKAPGNKKGIVLKHGPLDIKNRGIELIAAQKKDDSRDIRKSAVLVSAGAGVGPGFEKIHSLARELNGMTSSSRKLVDMGIASRNIQVGQSGKTVSPKLYIALGINGAMQHVEGIKKAEHIISVNINKDAPLCSLSDIVVEGDAVEFAQKLTAKIKDRRKITL